MKFSQLSLVLASAALLAACGGGGGGGAPSPIATTTPTTTTTPSTFLASSLVLSVAAPSYTAGTEELVAFDLLNAERNRCGFGMVAQNAALDTAARGHADWQLLNNTFGHNQVPSTVGFTGEGPYARAVASGYITSALNQGVVLDENTALLSTNVKAGFGDRGIRGLLNAPYHMSSLVSSVRDIGFAVRNDVDVGSAFGPRVVQQVNLGYKTAVGPQLLSSTDVQTYPCEGATNITRMLQNESPNPVPGRDLAASPLGSTIYIAIREGQTIQITSASMIKVSTGAAVTLRNPVTMANDPNPGYYKSHEAYVTADAALDANTQYQVTINGSNDGAAFSRTFTFVTGT